MKVSLIITTYNWKEALAAVLQSILKQSCLPDEVIVADDGSRDDTKLLIQHFQSLFPIPLIHSWQPDDGFRASRSRNLAISRAIGDYIIIIDGDIVIHKHFVQDHKKMAKKGNFIQGGRAKIGDKTSALVISNNTYPSFYAKDIKNRKNLIHNPILCSLFSRIWNSEKSTRSCNMSFWKKDIIAVNGFNEDFTGWGREDSELVYRFFNLGLNRLYLKFSALGFHLYHQENSRGSLKKNDEILENTITNKLVYCNNGLTNHTTRDNNENPCM
ncbi:family 2 glycosyl transferase [Vibrio sp. UCD-FRSSP16_10]|uniref:glycosyltransferase family 2 protein n=1 Tax=unclassified Vibrio TaxID=2614977 RepID=UPI0008000A40|nr:MULTISPECIES: glycosyltransferase family 2 protein [unclassified Vibrio]OBT10099.1 family 2 glycosyl transferase [Vibrio sp. UCD-FRSSP16_30]OBT18889.1 family 2 glycosyl transferase [Vibrio sp. UCD-FRSSP16_10]